MVSKKVSLRQLLDLIKTNLSNMFEFNMSGLKVGRKKQQVTLIFKGCRTIRQNWILAHTYEVSTDKLEHKKTKEKQKKLNRYNIYAQTLTS